MPQQMSLDLFGVDQPPPILASANEEQLTLDLNQPIDLPGYLEEWNTDNGFEATELPEPTTYTPGSWDKVEILAQRLAKGQQLWHPDDAERTRKSQAVYDAFRSMELIADED